MDEYAGVAAGTSVIVMQSHLRLRTRKRRCYTGPICYLATVNHGATHWPGAGGTKDIFAKRGGWAGLAPSAIGAVRGIDGVRGDENTVTRHLQVQFERVRAMCHGFPTTPNMLRFHHSLLCIALNTYGQDARPLRHRP